MVKSASSNSYTIPTESRREVETIMDRIYNENPSFWPEGLSVKGHDDLYMVREASTDEAAGFVGWQMRKEGSKRIGYYTIGILPEYRRNGLAKEAVSKLISKKAEEVDIVRAFIAPHNKPSVELAKGLDVDIVKAANWRQALLMGLGALGSGVGMDAAFYSGGDYGKWLDDTKNFQQLKDPTRMFNLGVNTLTGLSAGGIVGSKMPFMDKIRGGAIMATAAPATNFLTEGTGALNRYRPTKNRAGGMSRNERLALLGLGGAGLGVAAIGGHSLLKRLKGLEDVAEQATGGRMKVTLPTQDPNDRETVLELPFDDYINVSQTAEDRLQRDLRRRVNAETRERTKKREPRKKKKDEEEKKASILPVKGSSVERLKTLVNAIYG